MASPQSSGQGVSPRPPPPAERRTLLIGGVYQRSSRKEPLGEGSFAKVYEGMNKETRELVAIKMVSWEKLERQQPRYVQRHKQQLRNEIACLQSLNHANIVRLLHHQNTPKWFIMVLEFCAGGDLAQAIKRRKHQPVDEGVARYLIKQLADGLRAMRDLNWVHRDLKPGNLLLSSHNIEDAVLKIGDFGFARDLAPESLAETWVGSPLYMAPEILTRESGGYDAKADLWSVGCILFELVMGKQPYGSRAGNHMELMDDIRADRKYVPETRISLSDPCGELLDRLLQRVPAQRLSYDEFFVHEWLRPDGAGGGGGGGAGAGSQMLRSSISGDGKGVNNLLSHIMSTNTPPANLPPPSQVAAATAPTPALAAKRTPPQTAAAPAASPAPLVAQKQPQPQPQPPPPPPPQQQQQQQQPAREGLSAFPPMSQHAQVALVQEADGVRARSPMEGLLRGERSKDSGDDFELIDNGSATHEAVLVDSERGGDDEPPQAGGGGRRKPSLVALMAALPSEVADVALHMEALIGDVVACTREVVELANDKLRERPTLASQALVLYLWSLRLLHRAQGQLQELQGRCGGLLPPKLISAWQLSLKGHLGDDFCKAKLAMRMGVEASLNSDAPWITSVGQVNQGALGRTVAPCAERIAYSTALNCGRTAAAHEMLFAIPWTQARAMYKRALLLTCALMLESQSPVDDRKVLSSFAQMFASRLRSASDVGGGGGGGSVQDLVGMVERCSNASRLVHWTAGKRF